MASILACATAPYVCTAAGVLMPVQRLSLGLSATMMEQIAARIYNEAFNTAYTKDFQDVFAGAAYKHVNYGYRIVEKAPGVLGFECFTG